MYFRHNYYFLSNFFPCNIVHDGNIYKNAESIFQMEKMLNDDDKKKFIGLNAQESKKIGNLLPIRKDWNNIKVKIMNDILHLKFEQNNDLFEKLLSIKEEIIEHNNWHDNFWGVCLCDKCIEKRKNKEIVSKNFLGRLLTHLQKNIK